MDLFELIDKISINLLPTYGEAFYYDVIMSEQQADQYTDVLIRTIQWQHDEAIIMGKKIITKRKVVWYGEDAYSYTYYNVTKTALPWTKELLEL